MNCIDSTHGPVVWPRASSSILCSSGMPLYTMSGLCTVATYLGCQRTSPRDPTASPSWPLPSRALFHALCSPTGSRPPFPSLLRSPGPSPPRRRPVPHLWLLRSLRQEAQACPPRRLRRPHLRPLPTATRNSTSAPTPTPSRRSALQPWGYTASATHQRQGDRRSSTTGRSTLGRCCLWLRTSRLGPLVRHCRLVGATTIIAMLAIVAVPRSFTGCVQCMDLLLAVIYLCSYYVHIYECGDLNICYHFYLYILHSMIYCVHQTLW